MGNTVRRVVRNWNVENRAQKQLMKDSQSARPAPKPKTMKTAMEEARAAALASSDKDNNASLVERMSQMHIKSSSVTVTEVRLRFL